MNISEQILAIAKHEWPDENWQVYKIPQQNNRVSGVAYPGQIISDRFNPLEDANDLQPLVVKYRILIGWGDGDPDAAVCWIAYTEKPLCVIEGKEGDDSEQEYSRVAIEALHALLCEGET